MAVSEIMEFWNSPLKTKTLQDHMRWQDVYDFHYSFNYNKQLKFRGMWKLKAKIFDCGLLHLFFYVTSEK